MSDLTREKINRIKQGENIKISERELDVLMCTYREAKSFHLDVLQSLIIRRDLGYDVAKQLENLAIDHIMACNDLRQVKIFKEVYRNNITK